MNLPCHCSHSLQIEHIPPRPFYPSSLTKNSVYQDPDTARVTPRHLYRLTAVTVSYPDLKTLTDLRLHTSVTTAQSAAAASVSASPHSGGAAGFCWTPYTLYTAMTALTSLVRQQR